MYRRPGRQRAARTTCLKPSPENLRVNTRSAEGPVCRPGSTNGGGGRGDVTNRGLQQKMGCVMIQVVNQVKGGADMGKRMKAALIAAAMLCMIAAVLVYTRPLTIEQRYPVLDLSQCTLIRGYFHDGTSAEAANFTIAPGDPNFGEMIERFQSAAFKKRLRNMLPRGTKTHLYEDGDFRWFVVFQFEDVLFPSGDTGSGDMLHVNNFFGDVELSFDGEQVECSVENQEQWLKDVMSIIVQCPE